MLIEAEVYWLEEYMKEFSVMLKLFGFLVVWWVHEYFHFFIEKYQVVYSRGH